MMYDGFDGAYDDGVMMIAMVVLGLMAEMMMTNMLAKTVVVVCVMMMMGLW